VNYSSQLLDPPGPPINISGGAGAAAFANYGVMRAAVAGSVQITNAESSATAFFDDQFVITPTKPVNFALLSLEPKWYLNQAASITNDAVASIGFAASIGSFAGVSKLDLHFSERLDGVVDHSATVVTSDEGGSTLIDVGAQGPTYVLPIISVPIGQPITVSALLALFGTTGATKVGPLDGGLSFGAYNIDAAHSAYWGGLTLFDPDGDLL
jgi:hypothetical protein